MLLYNWLPLKSSPSNIKSLSVSVRSVLSAVVHYVSSTAEDTGFCSVGSGLRRLSALRQEDVDRQVRPQSAGPVAVRQHGERERSGGDTGGMNQSRGFISLSLFCSYSLMILGDRSSGVLILLHSQNLLFLFTCIHPHLPLDQECSVLVHEGLQDFCST